MAAGQRSAALTVAFRHVAAGVDGPTRQPRSERGGEGATGGPAGEEAAAEEGAFEGAVAVHAAAAEAGGLARRRTRPGPASRRPAAPGPPGRSPAHRASCGSPRAAVRRPADRPTRPAPRPVDAGRAARAGSRSASAGRRRICAAAAVATTCGSLPRPLRTCRSRCSTIERRALGVDEVLPGQLVHLGGELGDGVGGEEVDPVVGEGLHLRASVRVAAGRRADPRSLPVRSPFCSDPESPNSLPIVSASRTNHEYGYPLAVTCRSAPRASNPGNSGAGNRSPAGVQPERGRARAGSGCRGGSTAARG